MSEELVCEWGRTDCQNLGEKCHLCASPDFHYKPPKNRPRTGLARTQAKESGRKGAGFEKRNHDQNKALLEGASTRMTPNSGAGKVKGDQEIQGIIEITEELKEQNQTTARGEKTFTIHKEWLTKLNMESRAANKEFWYLKFSFAKNDHDTFIVLEADTIMGMVFTMVEDRKKAKRAQLDIDVANRRRDLVEAENAALRAEIELLKAELARERHQST